jgi:hypothetical protein
MEAIFERSIGSHAGKKETLAERAAGVDDRR